MINLTKEYVTTEAEEIAKQFVKNVDKNQIRKFYDDFKLIERRIKTSNEMDDNKFKQEILPHIKFIKTKIAYSAGRKQNNKYLVSKKFKEYFDKEIDKIEKKEDFENFMMHYQAIIAYFTYLKEHEKNNKKGK